MACGLFLMDMSRKMYGLINAVVGSICLSFICTTASLGQIVWTPGNVNGWQGVYGGSSPYAPNAGYGQFGVYGPYNAYRPGFGVNVPPGYFPPDPRLVVPPVVVPPMVIPPAQVPRSVLVSRNVIANPPLPPATIQFVNSYREALRLTITDIKKKQVLASENVGPKQSISVQLPCDAGGRSVEVYQALGLDGTYQNREVVREIPPTVRYQVTIHQWQVQSIAIDRTGKSPNVIEDINMQGRGLGMFSLPPGNQLQDGQIDVYQSALGAQNQGAIAPIQPLNSSDQEPVDPLRRVIEELRASGR